MGKKCDEEITRDHFPLQHSLVFFLILLGFFYYNKCEYLYTIPFFVVLLVNLHFYDWIKNPHHEGEKKINLHEERKKRMIKRLPWIKKLRCLLADCELLEFAEDTIFINCCAENNYREFLTKLDYFICTCKKMCLEEYSPYKYVFPDELTSIAEELLADFNSFYLPIHNTTKMVDKFNFYLKKFEEIIANRVNKYKKKLMAKYKGNPISIYSSQLGFFNFQDEILPDEPETNGYQLPLEKESCKKDCAKYPVTLTS